MKTTYLILSGIAILVLAILILNISLDSDIQVLEGKIEELKPKETKTIEDYHNLIEESKKKIDEIVADKWLKASDIKDKLNSYYGRCSFLESEEWQELLKKAEDAPQFIQWEKATDFSLLDVRIGITAEQILEALKSIDPNSFIKQIECETITDPDFKIEF